MGTEEKPKPGVFLSHNHGDKPFVRRLAKDLLAAGARVWIDEAEILVGDSLLDKIQHGISDMDYLGVVLSPESVQSVWVKTELEMAMNMELNGRKVKVLPLLYRPCQLPPFLIGKLYADFSSEEKYAEALGQVLRRLGVQRAEADAEPDVEVRLAALSKRSPLLGAALGELSGGVGPTEPTVAAIISSKISDADLSAFWLLLAQRFEGDVRYNVAVAALKLIDERGVGHATVEFCLEGDHLSPDEKTWLGMHMQCVTSREAVVWCHEQMVSRVRSDTYYHSFLSRHRDVVLAECYEDMTSYLLYPDRGPAYYNIDSLFLVAEHAAHPEPFLARWQTWIRGGRFESGSWGSADTGEESAEILYKIFNEIHQRRLTRLYGVIETAVQRVESLLKSSLPDLNHKGLYHLNAMVDARFVLVDGILEFASTRVYRDSFSPEGWPVLQKLLNLLRLLSRLNREGEGAARDLKNEFGAARYDLALTDRISGFWG